MMFKYTSFFGLVIIFTACSQKPNLQKYMLNSWQTTYLKIEMPTYKLADSTYVFEDNFENNPKQIAQSKYFDDGTFDAWFVDDKGKKNGRTTGLWNIKNDSLFVQFFYGGRNIKVTYKIEPIKNGFIGTSLYDWDNDGELDDVLTMKTKKI